MLVPLNRDNMSITNQENPKTIEKEPLNPLRGLLPAPPPSRGEHSGAVGLENLHRESKAKAAGKEKPLDAKQCDQLQSVALLYVDFATWLSLNVFSPDVDHVRALLRDFHPIELLLAQTSRFGLGNDAPKKSMAQFFYKSARPAMEAARLKATPIPPSPRINDAGDWLLKEQVRIHYGVNSAKEFLPRWRAVITEWNKYRGNDTFPSYAEVNINELVSKLKS